MEIICFKLIAGDVLRYSEGGLIECYSKSHSGVFRLRKIVDDYSFKAELSMRSKKQEISHDYFLRIRNSVIDHFSNIQGKTDAIACFNVPGGNATRYNCGNLIERVKINDKSCEITDSIDSPILFNESLKVNSNQYLISNEVFNTMRSDALSKLSDKSTGIDSICSNKIQIELF